MTSGSGASRPPVVTDASGAIWLPTRTSPVNLGGLNPEPHEIGVTETYVDPDDDQTDYVRILRSDGSMYRETFYDRGVLHRLGRPAIRYFRPDGSLESERYYRENEPHRIDGPAVVEYASDGSVERSDYYFAGMKSYGPKENTVAVRSLHPDEEIAAEFAAGHLARFLDAGHSINALLDLLEARITSPELIAAVLDGSTPLEWAVAFETGQT